MLTGESANSSKCLCKFTCWVVFLQLLILSTGASFALTQQVSWSFHSPWHCFCDFCSLKSSSTIFVWTSLLLKKIFFFFSWLHLWHYRSSQARGRIGAAAAGLHNSHSKWDLSHVCDLHHSSRQRWILNPLREARDWTRNLKDTSWVC